MKASRFTAAHQSITFSRRMMLVGGAQAAFGGILIARLGWLSIAENEKYTVESEDNRVQLIIVPPRRGWIVDRAGKPIAINRSDFRVDLIPEQMERPTETLRTLAQTLKLTPDDVDRIIREIKASRGYQPVQIAENVPYDQYAAITVRLPEMPGVQPMRGFSRFYPTGPAVGHLVGYVGAASAKEYEAEKNPLLITPGFKIGKEGLEKTLEKNLRGQPGGQRVELTARGKLVRELEPKPDRSGQTVQLAVDAGLQEFAARRLGEESGSCTILDCQTGDILCMASMPAYDPNSFSDGIGQTEWRMLAEDPRKPLTNKVLSSLYPPGSTIKPMNALALQAAGVDPDETIFCPGGYRLGNRFFRCLGRHGTVNMRRAIAKSCNTYFYAMGHRVGYDRIAEMARRMGLGQKFDLPVVSQSFGTVPDSGWKARKYKESRRIVERPDWTASDTLNASIGQGFLILNPLQLAVMAARIASGRDVQPTLIGRHDKPAPLLGLPQEHLDTVRGGMWQVVNGDGTAGASRLPVPGIEMCGKTGTAQVRKIVGSQRGQSGDWKYRDHGLFVFFAPFDQPRYAGSVVIEHGLGGARAAAPVAKDVLTYLFDQERAWASLNALEQQWGGTLLERTARRQAQVEAASQGELKRMISSAIIPQPLARLPWRLIWLVALICTIGIITLFSAAGGHWSPWALKQAITILAFFGLAVGISYIPENFIKQVTFPTYVMILLLLIVVEMVGFVGKGAQRWIDLGFIRLQPSEFMKPGVVLVLARFFDLIPASDVRRWRGLWPAALLVLVPWALILVQPDLGTATMVLVGGVTVMFVAGLPMWYFLSAAAALAAALPVVYAMMHDYQRKRVLIFLDPEADPLGAGYHISQSKIAIGSGGIWGKGYLNGSQSHLDYLPEGHTDFVFATFVEEWGLAGGVLLIIAFAMVVRWGMRVSRNAKTRYSQLVAAGLSMTIFFYFTVNLMMVMGLAPVVGIPLPLVSYGGSAVMTVMICLGLLMGIERQSRTRSSLT